MISPVHNPLRPLYVHGDRTHAPTDPSSTAPVDGVVFCPWAGYHGDLSPVWHQSLDALPLAGPLCGPAPEAHTRTCTAVADHPAPCLVSRRTAARVRAPGAVSHLGTSARRGCPLRPDRHPLVGGHRGADARADATAVSRLPG